MSLLLSPGPQYDFIVKLSLPVVGPLAAVYTRASLRLRQGYASGSQSSYYNKFYLFLVFCFYYDIDIHNYNINHSISFIEFLAYNGLATPTIATYISAIKAKCIQFNLTTAALRYPTT